MNSNCRDFSSPVSVGFRASKINTIEAQFRLTWLQKHEDPALIRKTLMDTNFGFGSFILLASYKKSSPPIFTSNPSQNSLEITLDYLLDCSSEHALIMLSSSSESGSSDVQSGSEEEEEESDHCWWSTGGSTNDQDDDNNNNNDIITTCSSSSSGAAAPAKYHRMLFKVDSFNLENQQLVFKLDCLGFPQLYKFCYPPKDFRVAFNPDPKEIVGSCNGLVCLYDRHLNKVSLWNPLTGQFRILPECITFDGEKVYRTHRLVTFGYDVETKDYKVVLFAGFSSKTYKSLAIGPPIECLCRVQVYSSMTDSWNDGGVTSLPGDPFQYPSEVLYMNGSCFFLAHFFHSKQQRCIPANNRFIISFDFTKEIITPIQLPDHHRDQELYLFSYLGGDKIALFTATAYLKDTDNNDIRISHQLSKSLFCSDVFNIWVFNEQGSSSSSSSSSSVKMESWTKLHSFQIERERPGEWNLPRGISNDGDFALLETRDSDSTGVSKKMKLFSLVTKKVKGNFVSCSRVMSKAYPYTPSSIQP